MNKFITTLIDIIFPPNAEELALRQISIENFANKVGISPCPPFPFITSLFHYKNPLVKELIWQIKNKKDGHALEIASYYLYKKLKEMETNKNTGGSSKIILVPIPISKARRRERGYNQCEFLIDGIMRLVKENGDEDQFEKRFDILVRIQHTAEKQAFRNREERFANTEDIFSVQKIDSLLDQKIIIIDDVVTTGSTVRNARETMLKVGYRDVEVVAVAH